MSKHDITRRDFLKAGAAAGAATLLGRSLLAPGPAAAEPGEARLYVAHHDKMVDGTTPADVRYEWVKAGMDSCAMEMSGKDGPGTAWQALFPGIEPSNRIAIKINCLKTHNSPQFATVKALVEGLKSMFKGTYPAGNISLFDNTLWAKQKVRAAYGARDLDSLGGIVYLDPAPQYDKSSFKVRSHAMHPAVYLARAKYGVSFSPLKRHQVIKYGDGTTGVIKNMMGACSSALEKYKVEDIFHDGAPFRAFADLFRNYMSDRLHLHIVDMLFGTNHATGHWKRAVRRITMGKDPCAVDCYVADVLTHDLGLGDSRKGVPEALAAAGLGRAAYRVVKAPVRLKPVQVPVAAGRDTEAGDRTR